MEFILKHGKSNSAGRNKSNHDEQSRTCRCKAVKYSHRVKLLKTMIHKAHANKTNFGGPTQNLNII